MSKPVLSLDVSKESSVAAAYLSFDQPMGQPFPVTHTRQGLGVLLEKLMRMEQLTGKKPDVILESTGNYSKPITRNLQEAGYQVIVLNPLETHEQKRRSLRKIKTDIVDSKRIVKLYYLENRSPQRLINPDIAELRNFCRLYDGLNIQHIESQLRFQSILDQLFPHYSHVFGRLIGDSSLKVISAFPTPELALAASREEIFKCLNTKFQRKNWAEDIYQKLMAAAEASLPYNVAKQSNVRILREYVPVLMTQKKMLTDVRALVVAAAKEFTAFTLLKSIPGVGDLTAAVILAEIEDISLFPTARHLVAYAGLDPSVFESGRFKATSNKISKRGSNYLRKALFQAAMAGVLKRKNGASNQVLHQYYTRKVSEGKKKMVALIAASNKLLRIIYGVWRKNEPFKLN